MTYENSASAKLVASHCVVCNRPLVDAASVETGMGPECRTRYGYNENVPSENRREANVIIHEIATDQRRDEDFCEAIRRLAELGFERIADRTWFRRRREFAPKYAGAEWIKGPPKREHEKPMTFTAIESAEPDEAVEDAAPLPALPFTLTAGQEGALGAIDRTTKRVGPAVCVISGYAGTGKTTLLAVVDRIYGRPIVVTPTGKAALRVKQATGLQAITIHRWMYKPIEDHKTGTVSFQRRAPDEVPVSPSRIVLLDEASMVGPELWSDIWQLVELLNLKLICVGDPFQLPPVQKQRDAKPFSILDPVFMAPLGGERAELTEVLRQAQDSPIIRASMALRAGEGERSLRELPYIQTPDFANWAQWVQQNGGVTICHTNATRARVNSGMRATYGIHDPWPREGEPLLVLKNTYDIGLLNGEITTFTGWSTLPNQQEQISSKFKPDLKEYAYYGAMLIPDEEGKKRPVTLAVEELNMLLKSDMHPISYAAQQWARYNRVFLGDTIAPHLHANYGYCFTAHKAQGSQWPYAIVVVEPSIKLRDIDGQRWTYTAITRAEKAVAIYYGRI